MNRYRVRGILLALALITASIASGASAQTWPQTWPVRPVRLIVPYAPGGSVDLIARTLSPKLGEFLGQSVVVENRAGAGGAIGVDAMAKSAPDGYTIVAVGSGAITVNAHLSRLPYDPMKDIVPVSMLAVLPTIVAVHPSLPVQSIAELVAYLKTKPGAVSYASNGLGSLSFLAGELFKRMTGTNMVHVPYKGAAPATAALAAGEIQVGFNDSAAALPLARSGRLRALALTDPRRSAIVPELPTVAEAGVPGYEANAWAGMFAPAGTPAEVIARLNADVGRGLRQADLRERWLSAGMEPVPGSAAEMGRAIRAEFDRWGTIIKESGIKVD